MILFFWKISFCYYIEAVADRYFPNDSERFESFWAREAHQSILGQARAQRCRDKKAGYLNHFLFLFLNLLLYLFRNYLADNH